MTLLPPILHLLPPAWWRWWIPPATFAASLAFFHISEFALAFHFNRDLLSWENFLVCAPYAGAMALGIVEYLAEIAILGFRAKTSSAVAVAAWAAGAVLVAGGEALRKSAVVTAGRAFTHLIHRGPRPRVPAVVTRGVYRFSRHPGYLGWMIWAVGTMVVLANPISAALFAAVAWRFFRARIPYEEATLRAMYGAQYSEYVRRTHSGIPFIP